MTSIHDMQELPEELYETITKNLASCDLHSFALTCRKFLKRYKIYIMNKLNLKLSQVFGTKLLQFKQLMQETGSVIAGTTLIPWLLDERWHIPIQIFIPMYGNRFTVRNGKYVSVLDEFLYGDMLFGGRKDYCYDNYELHPQKWVRIYDQSRMGMTLKAVSLQRWFPDEEQNTNWFPNLYPCIEMIGTNTDKNTDNIFKLIANSFDFDICQNMYYFDGQDKLRTSNFCGIMSRETTFECTHAPDRQLYNTIRLRKDHCSGFEFTNVDDHTYTCFSHYVLSDEDALVVKPYINPNDYVIYHVSGNLNTIKKVHDRDERFVYFRRECADNKCILKAFKVFPGPHLHLSLTQRGRNNADHEFILLESANKMQ